MKRTLFLKFNPILISILLLQSSCNQNQDITRWNLPEGTKARIGKGTLSGNITYSPDGTQLAVASSIGIWLYHLSTGSEIALLTGHTDEVEFVEFSPDGSALASGGGYEDATIRIWDTNKREHLRTLKGHRSRVTSVSFSPDGNTLASGGSDGTVRLWDAHTGDDKFTRSWHSNWIPMEFRNLNFNTGEDKFTRVWRSASVNSIQFSPDGTTVASASVDETIRIWDVHSGEHLQAFEGHTGGVNYIMFSRNGSWLVSGSSDETIRIWDVRTGEHLQTLEGHTGGVNSVAYSPDWHFHPMAPRLLVRVTTIQFGCGILALENGCRPLLHIPLASILWRFRPMAPRLPARVTTVQFGCGTHAP